MTELRRLTGSGPGKESRAGVAVPSTRANASAFAGYLDQFTRRVIEDAMLQATAAYWRRRAADFEWARPRPGDFTGAASADELAARDRRLAETAEACRRHAHLLETDGAS